MEVVNDIHSRLNQTRVRAVLGARSVEEVRAIVRDASRRSESLAVCGGRHAMGGQQFSDGELLLDMTAMDRVVRFDRERGQIEMEAGAMWPRIIAATHDSAWAIRQKQTGADNLTLGGAVGANIHGRGLGMGPFVEDVEDVTLVDPRGEVVRCSRREEPGLFAAVVGGYGLFGVVVAMTLRLSPRRRLRRIVNIMDIDEAPAAAHRRVEEGCLYGDFQYAIDPADRSFLRRGVMACYEPVPEDAAVADGTTDLTEGAWAELIHLAHSDKRRAFDLYAQHYLKTHGQVYWSDLMQLSTYIPTYSEFLSRRRPGGSSDESLMIGELFVPPEAILPFMHRAREVLRETGVEDIYGTIRSIRAESTTVLAWARRDFACVIFNLRTVHTSEGVARTREAFRGLIDGAADLGGSYYLTYHRYATREQAERCHPRMREFLELKSRHDPGGVFQSDWYRHHVGMLEGACRAQAPQPA